MMMMTTAIINTLTDFTYLLPSDHNLNMIKITMIWAATGLQKCILKLSQQISIEVVQCWLLPLADNWVASVIAEAPLIFSTQPLLRRAARRLGYGPDTVNTFLSCKHNNASHGKRYAPNQWQLDGGISTVQSPNKCLWCGAGDSFIAILVNYGACMAIMNSKFDFQHGLSY